MNEYMSFVSTILTIVGTGLAILVFTRSFIRDEISHVRDAIQSDIKHISDIADQRHEDQRARHEDQRAMNAQFHDEQRATHARLDQLYQMFIELLKEGRK